MITVVCPTLPLAVRAVIDIAKKKPEPDSGYRPGFVMVFMTWMMIVMMMLNMFGDMDSISAEMDGMFSILLPILDNDFLAVSVVFWLWFITASHQLIKITKSQRPDYSTLIGATGVVTKWNELAGTVHLEIQENGGYRRWPMSTKKIWAAQSSQSLEPGDCVVVSSAGDKLGVLGVEIDSARNLKGDDMGTVDQYSPKWWQWFLMGVLLISSGVWWGASNGYESDLFLAVTITSGFAATSMPLWYIMCHYADNSFPVGKQIASWLSFSTFLMFCYGISIVLV